MAGNTIKTGKTTSVAQPQSAKFVLGSRPAVLRATPLDRIKPAKQANTRDYGKAPPLAGDTGMSGLS